MGVQAGTDRPGGQVRAESTEHGHLPVELVATGINVCHQLPG